MFYEFKEVVSNISNYNDVLDVLILYYFNKDMLLWYKHLIDNYNYEKKQSQIGILQNMKQDSVSRKFKSVKSKIKLYIKDLYDNHDNFIKSLSIIDKYGTENQKIAMILFLQHKSYASMAKILNISRYAAYLRVFDFFRHILKEDKSLVLPILSIRNFSLLRLK